MATNLKSYLGYNLKFRKQIKKCSRSRSSEARQTNALGYKKEHISRQKCKNFGLKRLSVVERLPKFHDPAMQVGCFQSVTPAGDVVWSWGEFTPMGC